MWKVLIWLTTLIMLLVTRPALAYCYEDWVCVETVTKDKALEFWLWNNRTSPFTATLSVTLLPAKRFGQARENISETAVLDDQQKKLLIRITKPSGVQQLRYETKLDWIAGDMHANHSNYAYLKPYARGEHYRIVQGFGGGYSHSGASKYAVDFAMPVGTPVHAARGGIVVDKEEQFNKGGASRRYARFANFIVIMHDDGTTGEYYHLKQYGVLVEIGDEVVSGQLIGYSGNTGFSSLPHLHFAVYRAKPYGKFESLPFRFASK